MPGPSPANGMHLVKRVATVPGIADVNGRAAESSEGNNGAMPTANVWQHFFVELVR